ncbi:hypothetical protein [Intestinibacillus sp. Marseille-P6563]|uniref:hypothetical protein n=1 Tax=Intestinibacillus sp. Marseille-P6563 TaxID=2364792 RepID=UPI000F04641D|nr:hypothetical protein [Intestinibacillus sp. Marseille-P6563]
MPQQLGNLIFDRTELDVAELQAVTAKLVAGTATTTERAAFLDGMKGAYNYTDINRVGAAVEYLTALLYSLGYNVPTVPVTDWQESSIQFSAQMEQYLTNVASLRDRLPYVAPDAPGSMEGLTYQEANDIEEILYTLEDVLEAMQAAFLTRQANTLFMIAGGVFNNV